MKWKIENISDPTTEQLMQAVGLLKSLSHPQRLAVLCHLSDQGEMSVGEIGDIVPLSRSALSQHLAILRNLGLVATRREQQKVFYSLSSPQAQSVLGVLKQHYCEDL